MIVPRSRARPAARNLVVALTLFLLVVGAVLWSMREPRRPASPGSLVGGELPQTSSASSDLAAASAGPGATSASAGSRGQAVAVGVRLRGQGQLEGRIIDRASAVPVPGVRVELLSVPPAGAAFLGRLMRLFGTKGALAERVEPIAVAESGAGGHFRFEGVRQGTYFLDARGPYHVPEAAMRARVLPSGAGGPLELYVNAGGRITGEVQMPDGTPAPRAKLTLIPGPGHVLTSALEGDMRWFEAGADEHGRFAIDGVPVGSGYELTAAGVGYALSHVIGIVVNAQQETHVVVRARLGGSIAGRVLTTKGGGEPQPLANAHLGVVPRGLRNLRCIEELLLLTHTATSADGTFRIEHVPPGEVDILCAAWEHLPAVGAKVLVVDSELASAGDVVLEPGATVRGRVVDSAGDPIAGASVTWNPIDWSNFQFDFSFAPLMLQAVKGVEPPKTDADGRFVAGPIAGDGPEYTIDISKLGFADEEARWNPARDGDEITVVLVRGGTIEGVVMDGAKAEPVTSFSIACTTRIDAEEGAPGAANPFSGAKLVEDPTGRFRLDSVRPGKAALEFSAPGYVPTIVDEIELVEGAEVKGVIVELMPGGVARGRVVDGQGNPIAGAQVAFTSEESVELPATGKSAGGRGRMRRARARGPLGDLEAEDPGEVFPPGMLGFAANLGLLGDRVTQTNTRGEFTLTAIDEGSFQLSAFHRDYCATNTAQLKMPEAGVVEGVEIALSKGGRIEGVVRDRHGEPLEGEIVVAFSPGSFAMGAPSGGQSGGMFQGQSGAQGRYAIEHVAPGSYFLVATRGDEDLNLASLFGTLSFDLVTVAKDEVVTHDLVDSSAGACRVHGRITYQGEPVTRANVSAVNFDTESLLGVEFKLAKVGEGGRYEFPGLAPGDWQVQVDGPGPEVKIDLEVPDAPELEIDLALPEGGVEGVVVDDATNEPIENCEVSLRPLSEERSGGGLLGSLLAREGRRLRDWSDEEGKFRFERLQEGEFEIFARGPHGGDARGRYSPSEPRKISVSLNRVERNVELRLLGALKLEGRVVDEQKQPIANARVVVRPEGGGFEGMESAQSDVAGRFEVGGLAPGTYVTTTTAAGFAQAKKGGIALARGGAAASELEIAMQRGIEVTVRVFDARGAPASGVRAELVPLDAKEEADPARVERVFASLFGGQGTTDAEGRVELGRFAPGKYRLEAQRGLSKATEPKVELKSGDDEIELRIDLR